ncbi:MAG: hypothetical protein WCV73_01600 [Patescibacteria group bacterium]|jgi:hypothetical protein
MDLGTHLFVGVVAASSWHNLTTEQRIITVIFAILPDTFEFLHEYGRMKNNGQKPLRFDDYNHLEEKINHWYLFPYNLLHNIFTPLIFFALSIILNWPLVYSLMWLTHLLLDLPSHKKKLGLKLWWPFSQKRLHGFFDWWLVPFFRGWELWGYWAILSVISFILIRHYW